jgi:COP9 signalosome complex subunit 6
MAGSGQPNPLLAGSTPSDTSPEVQLHPLVLLTISDYITRHKLRQQKGPIAGAILGHQNGREITMEVAFDCKMLVSEDGSVLLDQEFFQERLEQCALLRGAKTSAEELCAKTEQIKMSIRPRSS